MRRIIVLDLSPNFVTGQGSMIRLALKAMSPDAAIIGSRSNSYYRNRFVRSLLLISELISASRNEQIGVLYHANSRSVFGLCRDWLLVALVRRKMRIIFHCHGADLAATNTNILKNIITRYLYRSIDKWIFLNEFSIPSNIDDKLITSDEKIVIIDNGIETSTSTFLTTGLTKQPPNCGVNVLFVSNFIREKGIIDFKDLATKISANGHHSKLLRFDAVGNFIGDTLESELRTATPRQLQLHVGIGRQEVLKYFRNAHILVFPSRYRSECQPLVIVEALLAGAKVVAYDQNRMSDQFGEFDIRWTNENEVYQAFWDELDLIQEEDWIEKRKRDSQKAALRFSEERFIERLRVELEC